MLSIMLENMLIKNYLIFKIYSLTSSSLPFKFYLNNVNADRFSDLLTKTNKTEIFGRIHLLQRECNVMQKEYKKVKKKQLLASYQKPWPPIKKTNVQVFDCTQVILTWKTIWTCILNVHMRENRKDISVCWTILTTFISLIPPQ